MFYQKKNKNEPIPNPAPAPKVIDANLRDLLAIHDSVGIKSFRWKKYIQDKTEKYECHRSC